MKNETVQKPDFLFEVSWEVCNKVGGIHTVVSTKAKTMTRELGDKYILIGPDFNREGANPEFVEDQNMLREWRQVLYSEGYRVKVGRWNIEGSPIVALVDFSSLISKKDDILKFLWENYQVDSISGQWDYIEPVLFGFAAGKVIESYVNNFCSSSDRTVAHFHEWMTASGGLYLRTFSPYVATVFTSHSTVMGRCIAGNGLPLYSGLGSFNADDFARQFNVVAKHSLEKVAARNHDAFCSVSRISAKECKYLLGKEVDVVTPDGFEDNFVFKGKVATERRAASRKALIEVAEACYGTKFAKEPFIVGTSGRYEFKNKGLDVFIEALKKVAERAPEGREVLALVTVPAGNEGARRDLVAHLADSNNPINPSQIRFVTHDLTNPEGDPIVRAVSGSVLDSAASRVKLLFVPTYLQGADGVFSMNYYECLAGLDLTVFASYYEPWGYTPLESVAFSIPTITTSLAGFGKWVDDLGDSHKGVTVITRNDSNDAAVIEHIADTIERYAAMGKKEMDGVRKSAYDISRTALWDNFIQNYNEAYGVALDRVIIRTNKAVYDGGTANEQVNFVRQQLVSSRPSWSRLMVEKSLPERLRALEMLSRNLWWSWTLGAHELFESIDAELWTATSKNPIAFLDKLPYAKVKELEQNEAFLAKLDEVYAQFCGYMNKKVEAKGPRIAYFSMEYGLHSSLKIYSGGLGILAGDYIKEASDKNVPMVAVGLLYRYGYFTQKLSAQGAQEAAYEAQNFHKLPISPARDEMGNWCSVQVALPGRTVTARIWKCEVGRTDLYLLDTDHELNLEEDRSITHHLYGGDWENRLKQELLLGVGGIRALNAMGIKSDIYHCNEGHAAFIGLERIHNYVKGKNLSFSEALEVVRSSSLYTTHTPVPAGHDAFPEQMIRQYMSHYPERLGINWEQFINLGKTRPNDPTEKFSMSFLACNLSQEVNGVSWLHGEVSKDVLGGMWPGYFKDELHIGYVTNGVHFPTWTSSVLRKLYAKYFAEGFTKEQYDIPAWQKAKEIPDKELWEARLTLKQRLYKTVGKIMNDKSKSPVVSPRQMVAVKENFKPDVLTIGFARRFATYKRAHLLFTNLERLSALVNNPERPVQFVFAGKAHPQDIPGQDLIKRIVAVSQMPEFAGKILFLPNYDMDISRKMVQGVDIWLNTPTRPLEASGTSGEKAVMNGVMQFSVLDGWWVEGYKEGAGWMLPMERTYTDQNHQNELDAEMIYRTIEEEIVPLYYDRDEEGMPRGWIKSMKSCIADIASEFTTNRMLTDYEERFYNPLYARHREIIKGDYLMAREIAAWKRKVSAAWDKVKVLSTRQADMSKQTMYVGGKYRFEATLDIAGLQPEDIGVELLLASQIESGQDVKIADKIQLEVVSTEGSKVVYAVDATMEHTGSYDAALRVYPKNPKLPNRMDFALVKWA